MSHDTRKTALSVETVWHERGPRLEKPLLVGTAIAVVRNPFAGHYEPDLMPFQASLRELGRELASGLRCSARQRRHELCERGRKSRLRQGPRHPGRGADDQQDRAG
ncbi:amino acid synthesis family protein [Bradyrhizobium sp. STM 3561]|uniref:amino acid synthesis family protein n=1 Tax=Bradyrhizobium sp. STM 3561 TaxID=578923 RepID=UPI003890E467